MRCHTPVGTASLALAPYLARNGQLDEGRKGLRVLLRAPWEETRGWPSKPEVKGQEAPGEGRRRAETPKSTFFELVIGPVCGL